MVIFGKIICWRYVPSIGFFLMVGTTESICIGSCFDRVEGDGDGESEGDDVDKKRSSLLCVGSTGDEPILRFFNPITEVGYYIYYESIHELPFDVGLDIFLLI